jgi:hypothetical protein
MFTGLMPLALNLPEHGRRKQTDAEIGGLFDNALRQWARQQMGVEKSKTMSLEQIVDAVCAVSAYI